MGSWNFKKIVKEIAIGTVIVFILSNIISYVKKPDLDSNHLPSIEVTLLDGSVYRHEGNKPLVIHFWATWCKICKLEAQNIESLSKNYDVLTIAVKSGSDEEVQAYMQERNLSFKVLNDTEGVWTNKFKVEMFPTTFIYDGKGELRFTEVGYTTTAGLMARLAVLK